MASRPVMRLSRLDMRALSEVLRELWSTALSRKPKSTAMVGSPAAK